MNVHRSALSDEASAARIGTAEVDAFLSANEAVQYLDCVFVDLCGNVRGKRVARAELETVFDNGLPIPYSIYFLDARGEVVEQAAQSATGTAWPVPGSLTRVSWSQRPHAQVLMTLRDAQAQPYFGEPRNVLARVLTRFADLDLAPVVGTQIQFHLAERERAKDGLLQQSPELDDALVATLTGEIEEAAKVQGLTDIKLTKAALPAQFEVEIAPSMNALATADCVVFIRQIVRAVARRHKRDATFMAKPYLTAPTSFMRFSVSIQPGAPNHAAPADGNVVRLAIGGLQTLMAEYLALLAPNPNAFRRFEGDRTAPRNRRWGYLNQSANFSIAPGPNDAPRIEIRSAGADANPYLALASLLAGIHHGISQHLEPSPPANADVSALVDPTLPATLDAALLALENGSVLREYLGPAYVDLYCATKRTELERFRNFITAREYDWYA